MFGLWFVLFFFFKQKTAYEMRISDWSSDVCSSDLVDVALLAEQPGIGELRGRGGKLLGLCSHFGSSTGAGLCGPALSGAGREYRPVGQTGERPGRFRSLAPAGGQAGIPAGGDRQSTRLTSSH